MGHRRRTGDGRAHATTEREDVEQRQACLVEPDQAGERRDENAADRGRHRREQTPVRAVDDRAGDQSEDQPRQFDGHRDP
jgi:hypothetical protein